MAEQQVYNLKSEKDFERFFREQYAPICRKISRILKDPYQTEDLVQNVFVKIWEKRATLHISSSLTAYAYRAALNAAFNALRDQTAFLELSEETEKIQAVSWNRELEDKEVAQQVEAGIDCLPKGCKTVYILAREEGLSYKEIAETLGISIKTVENQMSKALKILREKLLPYLMLIIFYLTIF